MKKKRRKMRIRYLRKKKLFDKVPIEEPKEFINYNSEPEKTEIETLKEENKKLKKLLKLS